MADIRTADAVSHKIDLGSATHLFGYHVIETVTQEFDRRSGAEIRTSDTYNKQYIRIALDLIGSF